MDKPALKTTPDQLAAEHCEACHADAPRVSDEELATLLKAIPDWQPQTPNGMLQLARSYSFSNFVDAIAFANQVGKLAEAANHHPSILVEWGNVTVTWWTHKINGLHRNDFIMAAKTDQLLG